MILLTIKILIFSCLVNSNVCQAQEKPLNTLLKSAFPTELTEKNINKAKGNSNELQFVLENLYVGYKNIFSAQDSRKCSFYPSCSDYGIQAVKSIGIKGVFITFDRLTRCNGLNPDKYPILLDKNVFYDPVIENIMHKHQLGSINQHFNE